MKDETWVFLVNVLEDVIDPGCVERGCTALDPVHLIALLQKKLCEIGPVLARDAGDQRALLHTVLQTSFWSGRTDDPAV